MSNVLEMNPLAAAEGELAEYFEASNADIGIHAQCIDSDKTGGVFDERASLRLHLSKLRRGHREAVERARLTEMTLMLVDDTSRRTIFRAFERRGYAYETELGAVRLWQAFRRTGSNVGLLGLVLEVPLVADRLVVERARAAEKAGDELDDLGDEPTAASILAFLEAVAAAAFERWVAKSPPGAEAADQGVAWMHWLPRWFTQAKHAADRRLVTALRAYDDVRSTRIEWEGAQRRARERKAEAAERARMEAELDLLCALTGAKHA